MPSNSRSTTITMCRLVVFVCFLACLPPSRAKVCNSMDIRNEVRNLINLTDCTEIAGHLQILLIDEVESEESFDEYVFPELTEISGYLFFFSVSKLTSVGKLFPNLRVIRGKELFTDYALVIYDMPDIREIGTGSLAYIARGLVKVDKCPYICFVDTIDWIAIGVQEVHFSNINNGTCDSCPRHCPNNCWNTKTCQLSNTEMCHHECLGCHRNGSAKHCYVCKNYEDNGECVEICPPNKYIHVVTNKCVTEQECHLWNTTVQWWTFGENCINECPPFHEQFIGKDGKTSCRLCGSNCTRYCKGGGPIENIFRLQEYKGCTHINGSLYIRMDEEGFDKYDRELAENLGSIRYIRDALIIRRTNSLRSLRFLRSLKEIGGEQLENRMYAVFIVQNQNLQTLFNYDHRNFSLKIKNGTFAFHDNPLLCPAEIEKFAEMTGFKNNYSNVDVSPYSNGEKAACYILNMTVAVEAKPRSATLRWVAADIKTTLGYTVYYKPHDERDRYVESIKESIQVCVQNYRWKSVFTWSNNITLIHLWPFIEYAYYIKVYDKQANGPQSQIMFFKTLPDDPEAPIQPRGVPQSHDTIKLEWYPPGQIYGALAFYKVDYNEVGDAPFNRDYCQYPRSTEGDQIDAKIEDEDYDYEERTFPTTKPKPVQNCSCENDQSKTEKTPLTFPDWTIQTLDEQLELCDIDAQSKYKKNQCGSFMYNTHNATEGYQISKRRSKDPEDIFKHYDTVYYNYSNTQYIPPNVTHYNITGLKHFTLYVFYLSACNLPAEDRKCSPIEYFFARTQKKEDADDVVVVKQVKDQQDVTITWEEPKDPNSAIVTYRVMYEYVNADNVVMNLSHCIPRIEPFNGSKLALKSLQPGKYQLKVQAESLAGLGRPSNPITFDISRPTTATNKVVVIVVPLVLIIVLCLSAIFGYRWYLHRKKLLLDDIQLIATINPDYDGAIYVEDEWEISRNDIEVQQTLGQGTFGIVHYGRIKSRNIACAIKTVNESTTLPEQMQFLYEASVMKSFSNCHHVVRLLGVVSRGQPPLVVMELMERGDLKKYLRQFRDSSQTLTMNEIYRMAAEIADGMAYLSAKKFVHRDLAARNCMVAGDRTVKIGDFGMARDIYETDYYKKETRGLLPVRWMAPESLSDGVFTTDSDVWSYGIVLWEIATLAEQPYQGLSNEQVLKFVISKGRLTRPSSCSDLLYEIMKQCWSWRPNDRPTFWDIVERLESENHVGIDFKPVSFIFSKEGEEHRIIHGRQRTVNQPAMCIDSGQCHYRVSDEDIDLHVGSIPKEPSFLAGVSPDNSHELDKFLSD